MSKKKNNLSRSEAALKREANKRRLKMQREVSAAECGHNSSEDDEDGEDIKPIVLPPAYEGDVARWFSDTDPAHREMVAMVLVGQYNEYKRQADHAAQCKMQNRAVRLAECADAVVCALSALGFKVSK